MELLIWWSAIVALVVGAIFLVTTERDRRLRQALAEYKAALAKLKAQPTDANLRQSALESGRIYSGLTRKNKAVTLFDEMALKNDLDAASAGAPTVAALAPVAAPAPAAYATSAAERLLTLADLRTQGLISEEELQAQRTKILEGV